MFVGSGQPNRSRNQYDLGFAKERIAHVGRYEERLSGFFIRIDRRREGHFWVRVSTDEVTPVGFPNWYLRQNFPRTTTSQAFRRYLQRFEILEKAVAHGRSPASTAGTPFVRGSSESRRSRLTRVIKLRRPALIQSSL
jgi:hypothetical protein